MDNICNHKILFYLGKRENNKVFCRCLDCNLKAYFNEEEKKGNIIYYSHINSALESAVLEKYKNLKQIYFDKNEIVNIIQGEYNAWLMQHFDYIEGITDNKEYEDDSLILKRRFNIKSL